MADEVAKEGGQEGKKSKAGLVVGIVIGVIMLVGGSAAGILLGPKLFGGNKASAAHGKPAASVQLAEGEAEDESDPHRKIESIEWDPIVIDVRDNQNRVHHLKVGLAVELSEKATKDEFSALIPRGREAALIYLRSLTFEEVSKPERYEKIRGDLIERVTKAVGEHRVSRMLLIDFVAQ